MLRVFCMTKLLLIADGERHDLQADSKTPGHWARSAAQGHATSLSAVTVKPIGASKSLGEASCLNTFSDFSSAPEQRTIPSSQSTAQVPSAVPGSHSMRRQAPRDHATPSASTAAPDRFLHCRAKQTCMSRARSKSLLGGVMTIFPCSMMYIRDLTPVAR